MKSPVRLSGDEVLPEATTDAVVVLGPARPAGRPRCTRVPTRAMDREPHEAISDDHIREQESHRDLNRHKRAHRHRGGGDDQGAQDHPANHDDAQGQHHGLRHCAHRNLRQRPHHDLRRQPQKLSHGTPTGKVPQRQGRFRHSTYPFSPRPAS